ncbi:MAG: hypothetical protein FWG80_00805 [Alphaproteobacteria bacterium]|nr:hypothetical protein [Alphaproteobacteria bacterium]
MKKSSILVLPLILAACGGGGGGGNGLAPARAPISSLANLSGKTLEAEKGGIVEFQSGGKVSYNGEMFAKSTDTIINNANKLAMAKTIVGDTTATAELTEFDLGAFMGWGNSVLIEGTGDSTHHDSASATAGANNNLEIDLGIKIQEKIDEENDPLRAKRDLISADIKLDMGGQVEGKNYWLLEIPTGCTSSAAGFNCADGITIDAQDLSKMAGRYIDDQWVVLSSDLEYPNYFATGKNSVLAGLNDTINGNDNKYELALAAALAAASVDVERDDTVLNLVQGNAGLKYAAFGYYKEQTDSFENGIKIGSTSNFVDTFYGGNIDSVDAEYLAGLMTGNSAVFSGKAVASLKVDTNHTDLTGTAKLTLGKDESEKLDLVFNNWYNVSYDGDDKVLKYKAGITGDFSLDKDGVFDNLNRNLDIDGDFTAGYYSKDGLKDAEAAGVFNASGTVGTGGKEFELDGAFGGKIVK